MSGLESYVFIGLHYKMSNKFHYKQMKLLKFKIFTRNGISRTLVSGCKAEYSLSLFMMGQNMIRIVLVRETMLLIDSLIEETDCPKGIHF